MSEIPVEMPADATVVIAMATFRRPDQLRRILPLLLDQAATIDPPARILVVDNDPAASAREIVGVGPDVRGIDYVHEPRPGISAARNRALDESRDDTLLLFIDDDEVPAQRWLRSHVESWAAWRCAAVTGPAVPEFDQAPDPWVLASGFFAPWHFATGEPVRGFATNNVLLDLTQIRAMGLRFDEQFGLSGGSDTRLSRDLLMRGGSIRWCEEAQTRDPVPASRATRPWVRQRALRTGNTWARVALSAADTRAGRLAQRADLTLRGVVRLGRGIVRIGRGYVRGDLGSRARGSVDIASAAGVFLGVIGRVSVEYRRS